MRLADPALPERRQRQILNAARACFAHRGLRQTTIEDICAEVRISPGALYRYFGAKTDIVAAIAEEDHAEADAVFDEAGDLAALLAALARIRLEGDVALQTELWAEAARDPVLARELAARERRLRQRLGAAIGDAAKADMLATMLATMLDGLALGCALEPATRADAGARFKALASIVLQLE